MLKFSGSNSDSRNVVTACHFCCRRAYTNPEHRGANRFCPLRLFHAARYEVYDLFYGDVRICAEIEAAVLIVELRAVGFDNAQENYLAAHLTEGRDTVFEKPYILLTLYALLVEGVEENRARLAVTLLELEKHGLAGILLQKVGAHLNGVRRRELLGFYAVSLSAGGRRVNGNQPFILLKLKAHIKVACAAVELLRDGTVLCLEYRTDVNILRRAVMRAGHIYGCYRHLRLYRAHPVRPVDFTLRFFGKGAGAYAAEYK